MKLHHAQFRLLFPLLVLLGLLGVVPAAYATDACCYITGVNSKTDVVTAKVNSTGQLFQFRLKNRAQLSQLKVGQAIYANLKTDQISLDGKNVVGSILYGSVGHLVPPNTNNPTAEAPSAAGATCNVMLVDRQRRQAVAEDQDASIFEFTASPAVLQNLQPQQRIYANFSRKKVSLDGKTVAGSITRIVDQTSPTGEIHPERENYQCLPGYCYCRGGRDGPDCQAMTGDPQACSKSGGFFECDSHGRCFCSRPPTK
jgi:hypothetical protein